MGKVVMVVRIIAYLVGVAVLVAGALGLIQVIELHELLAILAFVVGTLIVIGVHERFGGPI